MTQGKAPSPGYGYGYGYGYGSGTQETAFHVNDLWRVLKNRWPTSITILVLVMGTGGVVTKLQPKIYESSAVLRVEKENRDLQVFQSNLEGFDPVFFQTEFEIIQSKKVLYPVIEKLGIAARLCQEMELPEGSITDDQAFQIFRKTKLQVQPFRNTKLIEVVCQSTRPDEAALYANTIADSYEEVRRSEITGRSDAGLKALANEVERQKEIVTAATARVEKLRKDLKIDELPGSTAMVQSTTFADQEIQKKGEQLSELRADMISRKVRLEKVADLSIEQLESTLPALNLEDPTTASTKQQYLDALQQVAQMQKLGYGKKHPEMQAAVRAAGERRDQLNKLIAGIRRALEIDLTVSQAKVETMEKELQVLREKLREDRTDRLAPYNEARRDLETQNQLLEVITARYRQQSVESKIETRPVQIVNRAEPAVRPVKPSLKLNLALSLLVGLVLGISLAFFIEYLDTSIKTMDDVERYLGLSVLAVIPKGAKFLTLDDPNSRFAEGYRILCAKLNLTGARDSARSITVLSGGPGEGKSTTAFNLAWVCAQSGMKVLMIDGDIRRPSVQRAVGVENTLGLGEFLAGQASLDELIQGTNVPNMEVLTAGSLGPEDLGGFSRARFGSLLEICRPNYDVIVVDSPPVLGISDASVISQEVDVTLLLIQHRRYPRNVSQRAKRVIDEVGGKLFGVILNNVNIKTDDNYYYYAGYSSSYYGYRNRTPRARRQGTPAVASAQSQETAPLENEEVSGEEVAQEDVAPRVTHLRPPSSESEDRF
ncbi:MAG: polysaccharide biosynthesis tyrosine autokinase [Verrucomicrobia bacterium]|nr:polysaccharide biosynthesis tyrosine autokinase [Verrucomicrobiota bacterium]